MRHTKPANDRRTSRGARTPGSWSLRALVAAALSLVLIGVAAGPAFADDYPSWQDVQNAKSSEAAAAAKVTEIQNFISQLQTQVVQTQAEAVARGNELQIAQEKFNDADRRAQELQKQADATKAKADAATTQAARLAAQLYRTGGNNLSTNIFLGAGKQGAKGADQLLSNLGSMTKLVERTSDIYKSAVTAQNTEKSVSAQADVAKAEREKLKNAADAALTAAVAAAKAAAEKLKEQQTQIVVLQAQLAALQDKTATTVAGYEKGVAERAAAAGASGGAGLPGGYVGDQGWANPVRGVITDGFGARVSPCSDCSSYHYGIDLGAPGGSPIYAAHDGTVIFAGPLGTCGNAVRIDHGGGIVTQYCHIMPGGILVGVGQGVVAGEPIARVGTTGASTGYHLHFQVEINGSPVDGIPFMAQRGAPLG